MDGKKVRFTALGGKQGQRRSGSHEILSRFVPTHNGLEVKVLVSLMLFLNPSGVPAVSPVRIPSPPPFETAA